MQMKIALYGANSRSIALASEFLKSNIIVVVIFDNDKRLSIEGCRSEYICTDNGKVRDRFYSVPIDVPQNHQQYDFDFIVVFAGSVNHHIQKDIANTLYSLGIKAEKVIFWSKLLRSGVVGMEFDWNEPSSMYLLMANARKNGIDEEKYLFLAEELLDVCESLFVHEFRLFVLRLFVSAIRGAINKGDIVFENVKMDYRAFILNPHIFIYEGADLFVDAMNREITQLEFIEGPYQSGRVYIEENDIVIDAGANIGMFSSIAATQTKGTIYAFEPVKQNINVLRYAAELYENIKPIPMALGAKSGKSDIDVSGYEINNAAASMMNIDTRSNIQEIDVITLDEFAKNNNLEHIDFIKADIEGAERLMLMGAQEVLKKYAPKLSICTYHSKEDPRLLDFLIKQFNPNYIIEHAYLKLYAYVPNRTEYLRQSRS